MWDNKIWDYTMNSKNLSSYPLLTGKAPKLGREKVSQFTRQTNISFFPQCLKLKVLTTKTANLPGQVFITDDMKSVQMWLKMKNEIDKKYLFCFVLFLSQIPKRQPDHAVIFKDICRAIIPGETVSEKG